MNLNFEGVVLPHSIRVAVEGGAMRFREIALPDEIRVALEDGATLVISISGGKDSIALLYVLVALYHYYGWRGKIVAVHADLGKMEWKYSLPLCERICHELEIELIVVRRPQGDLLREIKDRALKLKGQNKPPFPSAQQRYCTADQKRTPIDKVLRAAPFPSAQQRYCTSHHKQQQIDKVLRKTPTVVISAEGIRANESPARRRKPAWEYRTQICTRTRTAYTWRPLHDWTEEDVWQACGTSLAELNRRRQLYREGRYEEAFRGWKFHPAYILGNLRVSCAMCVLGSKGDITNGARYNRELHGELVQIERDSGYTFRVDLALASLSLEDVPPVVTALLGELYG